MKQGVIIVTWSGGREQYECLLNSLPSPFKYGLLTVVNDGNNADWIEQRSSRYEGIGGVYKVPYDGFELGALKLAMEVTDWDEFILLQDTIEILDGKILDILFENYPNSSVAYGPSVQMFLAKFRRQVLEKLEIPDTRTKLQSIYQESQFVKIYQEIEPFNIFNTAFRDENFYGNTEFRWGRENLILKDEYLIKRKGTWDLTRQKPQDPEEFLRWNGGS